MFGDAPQFLRKTGGTGSLLGESTDKKPRDKMQKQTAARGHETSSTGTMQRQRAARESRDTMIRDAVI